MNKKRLFFDFLQKHDALQAYKRAFESERLRYNRERTPEYIPLEGSFVWAQTLEGHYYWQDLNDKWHHYFIFIKKKYHF